MKDDSKILNRKLQALFTDAAQQRIAIETLERYGEGPFDNEPGRVRLAILKLSGSDLKKLEYHTELAKQDYRDVLCLGRISQAKQVLVNSRGSQKRTDQTSGQKRIRRVAYSLSSSPTTRAGHLE